MAGGQNFPSGFGGPQWISGKPGIFNRRIIIDGFDDLFLAGGAGDNYLDQALGGIGGDDRSIFCRGAEEVDPGKVGLGLADCWRIDAGAGGKIFDSGSTGVKVVSEKAGGT